MCPACDPNTWEGSADSPSLQSCSRPVLVHSTEISLNRTHICHRFPHICILPKLYRPNLEDFCTSLKLLTDCLLIWPLTRQIKSDLDYAWRKAQPGAGNLSLLPWETLLQYWCCVGQRWSKFVDSQRDMIISNGLTFVSLWQIRTTKRMDLICL